MPWLSVKQRTYANNEVAGNAFAQTMQVVFQTSPLWKVCAAWWVVQLVGRGFKSRRFPPVYQLRWHSNQLKITSPSSASTVKQRLRKFRRHQRSCTL